jgi:hypothetical protein
MEIKAYSQSGNIKRGLLILAIAMIFGLLNYTQKSSFDYGRILPI